MTETVVVVLIVVAAAFIACRPLVRALRGKGSTCACDAMCSEALRRNCAKDPSQCPLAMLNALSGATREKDRPQSR